MITDQVTDAADFQLGTSEQVYGWAAAGHYFEGDGFLGIGNEPGIDQAVSVVIDDELFLVAGVWGNRSEDRTYMVLLGDAEDAIRRNNAPSLTWRVETETETYEQDLDLHDATVFAVQGINEDPAPLAVGDRWDPESVGQRTV